MAQNGPKWPRNGPEMAQSEVEVRDHLIMPEVAESESKRPQAVSEDLRGPALAPKPRYGGQPRLAAPVWDLSGAANQNLPTSQL